MDKCELKDGKYNPCKAAYEHYIDLGDPYGPYWNNKIQRGYKVNFCPFCGVALKEPEYNTKDFVKREMDCVSEVLYHLRPQLENETSTSHVFGSALLLLLEEKYKELS